MNIVFFLHSFGIGGAERRCATVANSFAQRGDNVTAVLLDSPDILYYIDKRIKIFYLPEGGNEILLTSEKGFTGVCYGTSPQNAGRESLRTDKNKYTREMFDNLIQSYSDRIHAFVNRIPDCIVVSWVSIYSIACAIALKDLPNKFIFVECNAPGAEFDKQHYFNLLKRKAFPRADAAIFQTEDERDFYDFLENTRKYVIPNPVIDLKLTRYIGERKKTIVSYCRLRKAKRIPLLIEAFEIFHKDFPEYHLHIFGEGNERQKLIGYIAEKNLTGSVSIFDFDIRIHKKIRDYAMFVSSSLFEGMSNSMLEAMSIGLPVICTDCYGGGARAVIRNGENGLLVPVEDASALSNAMKLIAGDQLLADKLSENAMQIKTALSKEKICTLWHQALDALKN